MDSRVAGRCSELRLVAWKANASMRLRTEPSAKVTVLRSVHSSNATFPMDSRVAGRCSESLCHLMRVAHGPEATIEQSSCRARPSASEPRKRRCSSVQQQDTRENSRRALSGDRFPCRVGGWDKEIHSGAIPRREQSSGRLGAPDLDPRLRRAAGHARRRRHRADGHHATRAKNGLPHLRSSPRQL
eukprot:gene7064-biopygen9261